MSEITLGGVNCHTNGITSLTKLYNNMQTLTPCRGNKIGCLNGVDNLQDCQKRHTVYSKNKTYKCINTAGVRRGLQNFKFLVQAVLAPYHHCYRN